ncbi:MAG: hypothetical protein U0746_13405 [Gemmataceae bacterium]
MVFIPMGTGHAPGTTFPAGYNSEDFTFAVYGPTQKGIPPGKYKVTLNIMSSKASPTNDKINAQYSAESSPIEVDVTATGAVDIDISKFKK